MRTKLLIALLSLIVAFPSMAQDYTISCQVSEDNNGKTAYLIDKNRETCIDSCKIVSGAFKFVGTLDAPVILDVIVNRIKGIRATVIVEKGTHANVDLTKRPAKVSDNGGYNEKYAALNDYAKEANKAIDAKIRQLQSDGKTYEEANALLQPEREALDKTYRSVIRENKDNIFGAYFLAVIARDLYKTHIELDSVISTVKYAAELGPLVDLRNSLYYRYITQPGKMFVDFGGFTLDGKPVRLSDYVGKGKYVLIDFWASWCGPCKKEMPNIMALNKQYGDMPFVVLGINIGDTEDKFKATVAELGIDLPQIFVPKNNAENAPVLYNIETIPHTILFAPDGTILKRGLLGEDLNRAVEGCLK